MVIEVLESSKDNSYSVEQPTSIKITTNDGEVIYISVRNDSNGHHNYEAFLDIEKGE